MSWPLQKDIGAFVDVVRASDNVSATAAGAGDNTEVTGYILDRSTDNYPASAVIAIGYKTSLTAAKKLTLAYHLEHGDASDLADAADFVNVAAADQMTGAKTAAVGTLQATVDLTGAKRYVRLKFTPDLTHTSTDTAELSSFITFGPGSVLPV